MKKSELISMLNKDMADEHAAIIRYLVHGWLEGEDTSIGASLLSRSREEMWHMHWLGVIIGKLGGEPNFTPAPYPYDPTNRATIFRSYVEYEEKLIPHYNGEAEMVDDPHIRRVLHREAWESSIHARKFQRILDKLSPKQAKGVPGGERGLPEDFLNSLQKEVTDKYNEMLQHIRSSWVFQKNGMVAWQLMDHAMEKMKQIAHFAEGIAENGLTPKFKPGKIDSGKDIGKVLKTLSDNVTKSQKRHMKLRKDSELNKHGGMVINLDLTIQQEQYEAEELKDMVRKK
ncbi:MAG: ferritin-like domain-containing protein [Thermodesulfovibrionales bacterium]